MENGGDDSSTQVLVWDCCGHKRLKMPIRELYDKVGKTAPSIANLEALNENFQDPRTSSRNTFPRKAV